ncbi:MAG: DUF3341 domain-containing protein [Acidobacteria bacterium]|nr:DUF3341 domain-containing protein [Acidobacteriota bacterium]
MTALYALYSQPEAAQRAVDHLREAGIAERQITILSAEPLEEYEFGQRDRETWMTWIAALGALIGMATAYFLTSLTQQAWAIDTGGMPIVTNWTNIIIIFELTMLGAVFATVITLLVTARLPGRVPEIYDPEITDGKILIGVVNPRDAGLVERALRAGGIGTIKKVGL